MSFKKPFRAVPITLGSYQLAKQQQRDRRAAIRVLSAAVAFGAIGGAGSVVLGENPTAVINSVVKSAAVKAGFKRAREPQVGDSWGGCNDARAAGTAPIYLAEPGYQKEMDGDGDGIACETYM